MGSGSEEHRERAEALAEILAALPVNLLTGGGGGVMTSVSRAFAEHPGRQGLVIGVLPSREDDPLHRPKPGYPNPWVEVVIRTHLPYSGARGTDPLSRNHVNVLSSDAIVVLPGGAGTASEAALALSYRRPAIGFLEPGELPGLPEALPWTLDPERVRRFLEAALAGNSTAGEP
jgi:uncharacterized protein (TIGR00725 family)